MTPRSIAIAGCGIAGLACATLLARAGERIVVFDRMVRPGPVGSGLILQPVGLHVLDAIDAGARLRSLGASIHRLFGRVMPSNRVVLDVRYRNLGREGGHGVAVHRGALFEALLDAATKAGAEIVGGCEITGADGGRLRFANRPQSARFDLVIDALGVRSPIARRTPLSPLPFGALWTNIDWVEAGFDETALEQRYRRASQMVGVLPVGSIGQGRPRQAAFFWSLRQADYDAWRSGGLGAWKADVLRLWPQTAPFLDQIRERDQLIFASYCHGALRSPARDAVVHVGDSWHSASPQLGQGANMALLDAIALATALGAHRRIADALDAYRAARARHVWLYQLASWMFTPAYQSDGRILAWVRDWLMSPLSRVWPMPELLASLVAGRIGSPLSAIAAVQDG